MWAASAVELEMERILAPATAQFVTLISAITNDPVVTTEEVYCTELASVSRLLPVSTCNTSALSNRTADGKPPMVSEVILMSMPRNIKEPFNDIATADVAATADTDRLPACTFETLMATLETETTLLIATVSRVCNEQKLCKNFEFWMVSRASVMVMVLWSDTLMIGVFRVQGNVTSIHAQSAHKQCG